MAESPDDNVLPTAETLPRHLVRLAVPVLGEQLLTFTVGLYDVYLAGQLGAAETSAIGLAAYVGWMAALIFGLVRSGVGALVARSWGAGEREAAGIITARGFFLGFNLGFVVLGLLWATAPLFARSIDTQGPSRAIAIEYLRFDAFGQLCACLVAIGAAALRGSGDTRTPLLVLTVTNVVNMLVSPACVYGWGPLPVCGVTGIVLGTLVAQLSGMVLMCGLLVSRVTRIHLPLSAIWWDGPIAWRIMRIGAPAALDGLLKFSGHYLFLMVIARLGTGHMQQAIFAAHIVGVRVEALSYLPAEAWGIASSSLAGRLLGATSPDVALRTGHLAVRQFLWYPVILTIMFFSFAPVIFGAMHRDPAVAAAGIPAFRLMALYQIPNAFLIIYVYTLVGAGDTRFPMWCSLGSSLGVRVPVAYLCGVVLDGGLVGAWIGMGADNLIRALLISWRYSSGHWTKLKV